MGIIIRKAEETDLSNVLGIENISYPSPWPEAFFRGHLGEDGFMICENESGIIGYIVVGIKIPSLFERLEKRMLAVMGHPVDLEELRGHIMNIAVEPDSRHQGIGRELLQQGLDYLDKLGARTAELEVRVNNMTAIRLYEHFGFQVERRIHSYYQNGEDAYFMSKELCASKTTTLS